tara:strand:+ start:4598 stop:5251 length:654 start_codon:yes stop_codon:yes gene_type:complete
MLVKICGIQDVENAKVSAESGADLLGMVFVPQRRRKISVDGAKLITSAVKDAECPSPKIVGLFADQPIEEVNQYVESCKLDMVQLCGSESVEYCRSVSAEIIKVIQIPTTTSESSDLSFIYDLIKPYAESGYHITLDSLVPGYQGGTGHSFDWDIAASISKSGHSFLLAGGLTPDNVTNAIKRVNPLGVDVSTGVETNGIKDPQKISSFIQNARRLS